MKVWRTALLKRKLYASADTLSVLILNERRPEPAYSSDDSLRDACGVDIRYDVDGGVSGISDSARATNRPEFTGHL